MLLGFVYFQSMLTLAQFGLTLPALSIKIRGKVLYVINLRTSAPLARIGSYSGVEIVLVSSFAPAIIASNDNFVQIEMPPRGSAQASLDQPYGSAGDKTLEPPHGSTRAP